VTATTLCRHVRRRSEIPGLPAGRKPVRIALAEKGKR
jgi:hypothetical protein